MTKIKVLCYLGIILISVSCSWTPTEEAIKMQNEIKNKYSEILNNLPETGNEVEFDPEEIILNCGDLGDRDAYRVLSCPESQIKAIAEGTFELDLVDPFEEEYMLTGEYFCLDSKPFEYVKGYYNTDHERDVNMINRAHHLGIFRTTEMYSGKWEGDIILEKAWYKGWFFLIDLYSSEIIGVKKIVVEGDDEAWDWDDDNLDPLEDNLMQNVRGVANKAINKWSGTTGNNYFKIFYSEDLKFKDE